MWSRRDSCYPFIVNCPREGCSSNVTRASAYLRLTATQICMCIFYHWQSNFSFIFSSKLWIYFLKVMHLLLFLFWPCYLARGILVPQPRIEPKPPVLEAWSLNHWTAVEVWQFNFLKVQGRLAWGSSDWGSFLQCRGHLVQSKVWEDLTCC